MPSAITETLSEVMPNDRCRSRWLELLGKFTSADKAERGALANEGLYYVYGLYDLGQISTVERDELRSVLFAHDRLPLLTP